MTDATTADKVAHGPQPVADTPIMQVRAVTLRFGGVQALSNITFDVYPGELLALIGPNGAGKSSLINCVNGVYHPQNGEVVLDGHVLTEMTPPQTVRAGVGRTFQNLALFVNLNVYDNLMLGRHHLMRTNALHGAVWFGRARNEEMEHRRRCAEIIEFLDLGAYRYLPVGMLPYGIQKRVELGRALAMEPRVLLLDEPVAGMNREETEEMARHLIEIRDGFGCTTILVEHHLDLVMDLADRVAVLDFGVLVAIGEPAEVRENPRVVAAYLGGSDL
ncbi:MAG TPA: ABC transporter ATP-binding protein [Acidimicrobiales bacterium]